jgi:hypothetical protein
VGLGLLPLLPAGVPVLLAALAALAVLVLEGWSARRCGQGGGAATGGAATGGAAREGTAGPVARDERGGVQEREDAREREDAQEREGAREWGRRR